MHHSSPEHNQQLFPIATAAKRIEVTRNEPLVRIVGIASCLRPWFETRIAALYLFFFSFCKIPQKDHSCPRCRVVRKGICLIECDGCFKQWCYDCLYTWNGIRFRDIWSKRKFLCPECIGECSCAKPRCRVANSPLQHQPDPIEFLFTDPSTEPRNWGAISDPCERRVSERVYWRYQGGFVIKSHLTDICHHMFLL